MTEWNPKTYHDDGRTLEWGKPLAPESRESLKVGEIFTLLTASGKPHSRIMMDSYDVIRQSRLLLPMTEVFA